MFGATFVLSQQISREPVLYARLLFRMSLPQAWSRANAVRLGPDSPMTGAQSIALHSPVELNFKTKADVLALRNALVREQPQLVKGWYFPSDAVFGQIVGGRPWWGVLGDAYLGSGQRSIEGPAEESRFLANPFLLVAANCNGLGHDEWDRARITEEALKDPHFPAECWPTALTWWPREARAEVVYDVSGYVRGLSAYANKLRTPAGLDFDLVAYNARDFGLPYLYVSLEHSSNIEQVHHAAVPFPIIQFIHLGGSCGYPGGCNNMSPADPNTDAVKITALPAVVHCLLWKEKPKSAAQPPDMRFVIRIE